MELFLNELKKKVEVNFDGEIYNSKIENQDLDFQIKRLDENSLLFFDKNLNQEKVFIAADKDHIYVQIDGRQYFFDKNRDEADSSTDSANMNTQEVFPPMPGSVVKVEVKKGDKVKEGQSLIIIEAMKMETSLYSAIDGVVAEVNVEDGQQIDTNKMLICVTKEED